MNPYRIVAAVAESNLFWPLTEASSKARENGFEVELSTYDTSQIDAGSALWEDLETADAAIFSMINTDREATAIGSRLRRRPLVTLIYNCQPELMTKTRIGSFDALTLEDPATLKELVQAIRQSGAPLPSMAHVILAAAARVAPFFPDDDVRLAPLKLYARTAQYWLNASPENLYRLMHLLIWMRENERDGNLPAPEKPLVYPAVALWHPELRQPVTRLDEYRRWYETRRPSLGRKWVGVLLFRQFVLGGNTAHYRAVFQALESRGLAVIGGFATLDNTPMIKEYFEKNGVDALLNLTGFNLVGSMGRPDPTAAVELLTQLDVPYLVASPLLFQSLDEWRSDLRGLNPAQVALQVVTPELEGGIEPRVYGGRGGGVAFEPDDAQVDRLARRVRRWVDLRDTPARDRRIAVTIFSFPPDKGSVGSAAYLDVFKSLFNFLSALREAGYRVRLPKDAFALSQELTGGRGDNRSTPVAARLPADEYRRLVPAYRRIERIWGPAPGTVDVEGENLIICGAVFDNVFVGIQPGFGYEGDPMRLLVSPDAAPTHSFAAYYAWVNRVFAAHAVLHLGTHGALEFMPGKQVGLTAECFPDALTDDLPHAYFYSVNNPSEATIAKRRSSAVIVTYLSPPLSHSGLYRDLASLREAIQAWRDRLPSGRGVQESWETTRALAQKTSLDTEVPPPARHAAPQERQEYIDRLQGYLTQIEQRLIPIGLHVAGESLPAASLTCYLGAEAKVGRPEKDVVALPDWIEERQREAARQSEPDCDTDTLAEYVVNGFAKEGEDGALRVLRTAGLIEEGVLQDPRWRTWIEHMERQKRLLDENGEFDGLLRVLDGRYAPPSPGGDPVRAPEVLPTGRNMHALDPYRIPSRVARTVAKEAVDKLLARELAESGEYPQSIAVILWGTDNIKNQGEGVAQVLHLLGVEPVADSLGRLTRLQLVPLERLGRPRIDVVMTVSGIFRDIFGVTASLLQEAVELAASADEPPAANFVRKRSLELAATLAIDETRAAGRVFSNLPGAYGTGVNHVVDESDWEDRQELAQVYLERKSYALTRDGGREERHLFEQALRGVSVTLQNVDSSEIGLSDVDHYYEYLGGMNAAIESASGEKARAYVADTLGETAEVRTLEEEVALEVRTKMLNPKWYGALLRHGYQGVHEIANRLDYTFGWSATSDAVQPWVYRDAADTFALDEDVQAELRGLNPQALERMVGRLLEAGARKYWRPDDTRLAALEELRDQLEAAREGVPVR